MALGNLLQGYLTAQQTNEQSGMREFGVLQKLLAQKQAQEQAAATQDFRNKQLGLQERTLTEQGLQRTEDRAARAQDRDEERAFRDSQAEAARKARMEEIKARLASERLTEQDRNALKRELTEMMVNAQNERARLDAQAKGEKLRTTNMETQRRVNEAIVELERVTVEGGLIDQSTGSGVGSLVDMAGQAVGYATPGARAVGRLKPIFDLVLKIVPRFEGPQSDKDTQTYREAAGEIANPAIPNSQKRDAAKEVLRLLKERRGQFGFGDNAPIADPDMPPPGAVRPKK